MSRLAARVKYDVARRLIEKAMNEAAERNGVSRDDLEAMAVPTFGLDAAGGRITVLDTRKTTPTLRTLEKYAVRAGGATNHRVGLFDAIVTDPPAVAIRPNQALDNAAAAAARRALGDAWAWGRRQSAVSISTLTAATCALWAYDHAPASLGDFRVW